MAINSAAKIEELSYNNAFIYSAEIKPRKSLIIHYSNKKTNPDTLLTQLR
jgi:hypothetical protein